MSEQQFDPNLKEAMKEIDAVMKKYDCGGYVALISPTHSEFRLNIEPLWSCAFFEDYRTVRFRAKEKDYGSKEARNKAIESTIHLVMQIRDLGAQAFEFGEGLGNQLKKIIDFDHEPFHKFTPEKNL